MGLEDYTPLTSFEGIDLGDVLICLDGRGWSSFHTGDCYLVTELWVGRWRRLGIDLNNTPASGSFASDFALYQKHNQPLDNGKKP